MQKGVFVMNWPKVKERAKQTGTVVIAVCALTVSVYSAYLLRQEFIVAHRPYVDVCSRTITRAGNNVMDLNTVWVRCFNSPARITRREICYLVVETKENGEEIITKTEHQEESSIEAIIYPSEQPTMQVTIRHGFEKTVEGLNPKLKLRRRISIAYKALSSDREYFFEGNWDYNRVYNVWEDGHRFGN